MPKRKISTIKYYFFIFYFTIKSVLIDKASPSNMPVHMSIVPHPYVHALQTILRCNNVPTTYNIRT